MLAQTLATKLAACMAVLLAAAPALRAAPLGERARAAPSRARSPARPAARPPVARPAQKARTRPAAPRTKPARPTRKPRARPTASRPRPPRLRPGAALNEASNQFSYGRYARVVELLRPVVERDALRSLEDRVEALRLYGICLYLTDRKAAALRIFKDLVELAPETRLDPRLVQPEVVAAFERIRLRRARADRKAVRRKLRKRYGFLNLLPPVGQFQNGHWRKAVVVLSLEVAFLAANIGTYYALRDKSLRQPDRTYVERDAQGNVVQDHRPLAKALMAINYASLALLVGTVIYGMVDGYVYYVRKKRRLERLLDQPLTVLPAPAPGGGALSITLRY